MNAYCESMWNHLSRMARSMLVHADLSLHFWYESHKYATEILNILPPKGLEDKEGTPTTPYFIVNHRKPRIGKFHVFGCPCAFKRYQPHYQSKVITKKIQLQRGSRGVFVGMAPHQAGYLIYIEQPIAGSHLITSHDVEFDDNFQSSISRTGQVFQAGRLQRHIGTGHVPTLKNLEKEQTGDITTLHSHIIQDPKGLSEEGYGEEEEGISIPVPCFPRRSNRIASQQEDEETQLNMIKVIKHDLQDHSFHIKEISKNEEDPVEIYLPEPKSTRSMLKLPEETRKAWLKSVKAEFENLITNKTFDTSEKPREDDEVIPTTMVFKAKCKSTGELDKLKTRCCARGKYNT